MSSIECLPDELWLEIFSYIPYSDLFRCFTKLNQRINAIVHSKKIILKIKHEPIDKKLKYLMETLPEYIVGLCIEYSNQTIDMSPYKNLLSIHLSYATDKQLEQMKSNYFKYLNQLNIVVCSQNHQLENVLFGANRFNYLTACWFPNLDFNFHTKKSYQPCLTLRSLRLNFCSVDIFFTLLSLLPNLISFESAFIAPLLAHSSEDSFLFTEQLNMIRLKLTLRANVTLTNLDSILFCIPRLEQLYLNINRPDIRENTFDLIELTTILRSRVMNLKKWDIKINLFSTILKMKHTDLKTLVL